MFDRKEHWENVYRSKSSREVSWYQDDPALSLRLIGNAGLDIETPVIDVGGGTSRLVDKLCAAGYTDISVLDVSAAALAHAKQRLTANIDDKQQPCDVQWYEEDITRFKPPRQFGLWHDRAVFHFLTRKSDRDRYVAVLKKALTPGAHVIIMAFAIDGPLKCSGLDIVQYDTAKLIAALGPGFELVEEGYDIHNTPAGGEQKFAYFHLVYTTSLR